MRGDVFSGVSLAVFSALVFSSVHSQEEDAWLAVINQRNEAPEERAPQYPEQDYQQPAQRRQEEEPVFDNVNQSLEQPLRPPPGPRQPPAPLRPRQPGPRPLPPQRPGPPPPPPGNRPPPRPLPGKRRPPPPPKKGILDEIGGAINGAAEQVSCAAQGVFADQKLNDPVFINTQLECLLDRGECDEIGKLIKRMAPDIIRGGCHHPCDPCKKKQIQKVMSVLSRRYPRQFQTMLKKFGK